MIVSVDKYLTGTKGYMVLTFKKDLLSISISNMPSNTLCNGNNICVYNGHRFTSDAIVIIVMKIEN